MKIIETHRICATKKSNRTARLRGWLELGGDEATGAAWALLEKLVERREADIFQFTTMLKACYDSAQTRELIGVMMPKAGVKPDVVSYNMLVGMLMMEGEKEAARAVVEKEMPAAGVVADDKTRKALSLADDVKMLSMRRTTLLKRWYRQGGDKATGAAWMLLKKLVQRCVLLCVCVCCSMFYVLEEGELGKFTTS